MTADILRVSLDSAAEGIEQLRTTSVDAVVIEDACLGSAHDCTVEELLEELVQASRGTPVVICDEAASIADAVRYIRLGAHNVISAGSNAADIIEAAAEFHRSQRAADASSEPWRKHIVGSSKAIMRTIEIIRLVGSRRSTVLITGETGTGKEMVARAIHLASPRAQQPIVAVNCNALPENLLEAELFGHVKGAFTGAIQHRVGRFEQAHRGTLFLDEVGDLPLDIQTKLLRVLQEREFQRVGSSETIRVDVRLIAATNVDLVQKIREGKFREDLYYRLNVVPIAAPPLRERLEDIPVLAHHFVEKICQQEDIPTRRLSPETIERLKNCPWPGNVRQLENVVEMAVALSGTREILYPSDFPLPTQSARVTPAAVIATNDFEQTVGRIERQILEEALKKANGNKTVAAEMLGLKRTTLAAKLKSLEAVA
ncbi:MAG TPA: sigma-54 dependent transcriptional regulator [Bryobacteraceae bacterium]|nr:sigma-54 dependent transcriptional regulator [Bryobacteraceae bacterium]